MKKRQNDTTEGTQRTYFVPEYNVSVEAASAEEAGHKAKAEAEEESK